MAFRIYTKTGDKGETGLFGGRRVPKNHLRVESYGTLDELNAFTGLLRDQLSDLSVREVLLSVQERLFSLGAYLASDPEKKAPDMDLRPEDVQLLESAIDGMESSLPPLTHFILPGGHPTVSASHVCRTVCRRAERLAVALHQVDPLSPLALEYLNRLSDYFFVLARFLALKAGAEELPWHPRTQ